MTPVDEVSSMVGWAGRVMFLINLFLFFRDYIWGIYSILLWHHTRCALMYEAAMFFPHRFLLEVTPRGCPGRESSPGPTERQAGALTIELRLIPK